LIDQPTDPSSRTATSAAIGSAPENRQKPPKIANSRGSKNQIRKRPLDP